MSIETLVRHCAPTLAGIKVGNLVSYKFKDLGKFLKDIEKRNKLLNEKGLFFVILKIGFDSALVYVYRKSQLKKILENEQVQEFLKEKGYTNFEMNSCLKLLKEHLKHKDFPHEIGVFL